MTPHYYALFGLTVASDFVIPWAPEAAGRPEPDIVIRRAEPVASDGLRFDVPGVARYGIAGGRRITVFPEPGAGEEEIRLYLLGSALGVLLHQRGLLVLHANAIAIDDGAVLFMGPSGAGKSSLAGWFAVNGFTVLTDDVCAVDVSCTDGAIVLPGLTRLRLSDEAAGHLGILVDGGAICPTSGKHDLSVARQPSLAPIRLAACYLLSSEDETSPVSVHPLDRLDAVEMLMANTYRGFAVRRLGESPGHMTACLRVASEVPCFEARRGKDWGRFDAVSQALLDHARAAAARLSSASVGC